MITHKIKPLTFNNTYTLTKRNVMTGEEEIHEFHNVVLSQITCSFYFGGDGRGSSRFKWCYLGSGSGTPSKSDTALFSFLFAIDGQAKSTKLDEENNTIEFTYYYIFPASSSYIGTLREVGIGSSERIYTHALIVDSEGNPIEIEKTALDEIEVTVKIVCTRSSYLSGQTWAFRRDSFSSADSFGINSTYIFDSDTVETQNGILRKSWSPEMRNSANGYEVNASSGNFVHTVGKIVCQNEWDSTSSFVGYVNSILGGRSGCFVLLFPNESVFPKRQISNLSLGTGDGVTTDFVPEIPVWVKDTEVVYKNGIALKRGIDYLVDSVSNIGFKKELSLSNFVKKIDGNGEPATDKVCYSLGGCYTNIYGKSMPGLIVGKPIIYEFESKFAFTDKVNCLKPGTWHLGNYGGSRYLSGSNIVYSISSDGEIYKDIARIDISGDYYNYSRQDLTLHQIDERSGVKFLKVWIEIPDNDSGDHSTQKWAHLGDSFFGYHGDFSIRFVNPPEEGSVLTIDLGIDRPYKSSDNIIQYNPEFNF